MKKLFHILFISAYLIFNVGISVATHFCCCGTDSTLAVSYRQTEGEDCYEDDCRKQSCLTEVVSLKITDFHISAPNEDAADQPAEMITFLSPDDGLKTPIIFSSIDNSASYYSDPPLYLSNCTFRI